MSLEFINNLAGSQTDIPAVVSRLAGFFVLMQGVILFLQKKNDPKKDIWEPMSNVLLAGLFVFLFPELIKFVELMVNTLCFATPNVDSQLLAYMKSSAPDVGAETEGASSFSLTEFFAQIILRGIAPAGIGSSGSYALATLILKPLADFVNLLCFPTYWIVRALSLKIVYWIAPLVLVMGAMEQFRSLWKHWFMIYVALLVAGPALVIANNFCEECFGYYVKVSDSPILGFIIVALARFKAFQAVMDLCYRIFKV